MSIPPLKLVLSFAFGVVAVIVILVLVIQFPNPTPAQAVVFRIVIAIAVAGIAAVVPGFFDIRIPTFLHAGGALGVFAALYFWNPASLLGDVTVPPDSMSITILQGQSIEQVAQSIAASGQMTLDWTSCSPEARRAVAEPGSIHAADGRRLLEALRNRANGPRRVARVIQYDDRGVYEIRCD